MIEGRFENRKLIALRAITYVHWLGTVHPPLAILHIGLHLARYKKYEMKSKPYLSMANYDSNVQQSLEH